MDRIASTWAILAALALAPAAQAETTACTVIDSLPVILDTPAHYCLESDFTKSLASTAIAMSVDGIVLDCKSVNTEF